MRPEEFETLISNTFEARGLAPNSNHVCHVEGNSIYACALGAGLIGLGVLDPDKLRSQGAVYEALTAYAGEATTKCVVEQARSAVVKATDLDIALVAGIEEGFYGAPEDDQPVQWPWNLEFASTPLFADGRAIGACLRERHHPTHEEQPGPKRT